MSKTLQTLHGVMPGSKKAKKAVQKIVEENVEIGVLQDALDMQAVENYLNSIIGIQLSDEKENKKADR